MRAGARLDFAQVLGKHAAVLGDLQEELPFDLTKVLLGRRQQVHPVLFDCLQRQRDWKCVHFCLSSTVLLSSCEQGLHVVVYCLNECRHCRMKCNSLSILIYCWLVYVQLPVTCRHPEFDTNFPELSSAPARLMASLRFSKVPYMHRHTCTDTQMVKLLSSSHRTYKGVGTLHCCVLNNTYGFKDASADHSSHACNWLDYNC